MITVLVSGILIGVYNFIASQVSLAVKHYEGINLHFAHHSHLVFPSYVFESSRVIFINFVVV